jgi:hypothetical protein
MTCQHNAVQNLYNRGQYRLDKCENRKCRRLILYRVNPTVTELWSGDAEALAELVAATSPAGRKSFIVSIDDCATTRADIERVIQAYADAQVFDIPDFSVSEFPTTRAGEGRGE